MTAGADRRFCELLPRVTFRAFQSPVELVQREAGDAMLERIGGPGHMAERTVALQSGELSACLVAAGTGEACVIGLQRPSRRAAVVEAGGFRRAVALGARRVRMAGAAARMAGIEIFG